MMEKVHTTSVQAFCVWLFLISATLCSAYLAEHHGIVKGLTAVAAIMFIAAIKARAVLLHFMEIKAAPRPWRIAFEVWVWGVCGAIVTIWGPGSA